MVLWSAYSRSERVLAIIARTAHIGAMAILVGGHNFAAVPIPSLRIWKILTAATGLLLLADEASHSRHWIYQGRGIMVLAHVGVLSAIAFSPARLGQPAMVAALVIGSVGSHLPRTVRKWSLRHRKVVED
ncbi:MAG TPA: hypothetical protein VMK12_05455 [Anaeromyxobacteraceae bacterium]|nr:hypothetical protein [Anaeromyxobacteraceae bacterium]